MSCEHCPKWQADHHDCAGEYRPEAPIGYCPAWETITRPGDGIFCGASSPTPDLDDYLGPAPAQRSDPESEPQPGPLLLATLFILFFGLATLGWLARLIRPIRPITHNPHHHL